MPRCLMLTPFPVSAPRHGGQVRAASLARALLGAGWQVDIVGLYHADFHSPDSWGVNDIVVDDPIVGRRARDDMLFADLHIARGAAADSSVVDRLRMLLVRFQPDVVHVEHPWSWLVLQPALPSAARPKIVYSSQNIERNARRPLFDLNLGLSRPGSDQLTEATWQLEIAFAREADLTLSISDIEASSIAAESGRDVAYVPAASDMAEGEQPPPPTFSRAARQAGCHYAALMGSAYWPNVDGFFRSFPHGLGFLAQDEQIWVAGSLGAALRADARYEDFRSVNEVRLRDWGFVPDADKAAFFAAACTVIVPVHVGAGAKQKMADALASACPVIATSHALAGYGPLVQDVLGRGVYVADTPDVFRDLVRRSLRDGLPACPPETRERVSLARMTETLAPLYARLLRSPKPVLVHRGGQPAAISAI